MGPRKLEHIAADLARLCILIPRICSIHFNPNGEKRAKQLIGLKHEHEKLLGYQGFQGSQELNSISFLRSTHLFVVFIIFVDSFDSVCGICYKIINPDNRAASGTILQMLEVGSFKATNCW